MKESENSEETLSQQPPLEEKTVINTIFLFANLTNETQLIYLATGFLQKYFFQRKLYGPLNFLNTFFNDQKIILQR
jgi:hypothetical protein